MLAYLFVLLAIASRFPQHPWSFTPILAALLFFGSRMPRRQAWIPVAMLAATDVFLTVFHYGYPLTVDHFVTWAWYAAVVLAGGVLAGSTNLPRVGAVTLGASLSFFVISNFAVWACWSMYPKTLAGLATCYIAAVPFFRNALVGDLFFSLLIFSMPIALDAWNRQTAKNSL